MLRQGRASFCQMHASDNQWRVHGRIDRPIPKDKLAEFQRTSASRRLRSRPFIAKVKIAPYKGTARAHTTTQPTMASTWAKAVAQLLTHIPNAPNVDRIKLAKRIYGTVRREVIKPVTTKVVMKAAVVKAMKVVGVKMAMKVSTAMRIPMKNKAVVKTMKAVGLKRAMKVSSAMRMPMKNKKKQR